MNSQSRPLCLQQLKGLIHQGIKAIPVDRQNKEAVIVIGDTGVGKSTLMSCLSGQELVVKFDGIKATIDTKGQSIIKIGHQKYSQTSIPTKVVINNMAFYDCPGFKDNKGEQYEISNSFFVQRLLDIYQKVKIVLIVDESHISQARADKFPRLLKNLHQSFRDFREFQDGTCLIINRAGRENTEEDYKQQLLEMIKLTNQNGPLFDHKQQKFIRYLINNNRILLFKQANKLDSDKKLDTEGYEDRILSCIQKQTAYVQTQHIQNIISQNAKLAIYDFIDTITINSNIKIENICKQILQIYTNHVQFVGKDYHKIMQMKQNIHKLSEEIKKSEKKDIITILQRQIPNNKIIDFQEDFTAVLFFKEIYDRTQTYFQNLVNKIYSELSVLLSTLDATIAKLQKQQEQQQQRQRLRIQKQLREQQERQKQIQKQIEEQQKRIRQQQQRRKQQQQKRQRQRRQKQQLQAQQRLQQQIQRRRKRQQKERQQEEQKLKRQRQWRQMQQKQKEARQRQQKLRIQQRQKQQKQRIQRQARQWQQYQQKQRLQQEQRRKAQQEKQQAQQRYLIQLKNKAQLQRQAKIKQQQQRKRIRQQQQARRVKEQQQRRRIREQEQRRRIRQQQQQRRLRHQQQIIRLRNQQQRRRKINQQQQQRQKYRQYNNDQEDYNSRMYSSAHHIPINSQHNRNISSRYQYQQNDPIRSQANINSPLRSSRRQGSSKPSLIQQIQKAMQSLRSIEGELRKVKHDAVNLHNLNQQIGSEFVRIQQKYFNSQYKL